MGLHPASQISKPAHHPRTRWTASNQPRIVPRPKERSSEPGQPPARCNRGRRTTRCRRNDDDCARDRASRDNACATRPGQRESHGSHAGGQNHGYAAAASNAQPRRRRRRCCCRAARCPDLLLSGLLTEPCPSGYRATHPGSEDSVQPAQRRCDRHQRVPGWRTGTASSTRRV